MSAHISCIDDEAEGKECVLIIRSYGEEVCRSDIDLCLPQNASLDNVTKECMLIFDLFSDNPTMTVEFYFTWHYSEYRTTMKCKDLYDLLKNQ